MVKHIPGRRSILRTGLVALSLALLPLGCNSVWDDVTSREFWKADTWGPQPEPLVVLRDSRDGDKRHRALLQLGQLNPTTLAPEEAEAILKVISDAAVNERQVWTRIAAVKALGNWNDPRAVESLRDAYYRAGAFPGDAGASLRVQTLTSLGRCGHPNASEILVRVLNEPPVEGSITERQQKLEERLAAARALGRYSNTQVVSALIGVLKNEQDPGLRRRSHESLVRITGKNLPAEAEPWEQFLADPASAPSLTIGQRIQEILPTSWRQY